MAQIARLYTTLPAPNPDVADYSFDPAAPFPVIKMEVEASAQEFAGANLFAAKIIVRDMVNNIVAAPPPTSGNLTVTAPWDASRNAKFEFALPATITAAAAAGNPIEIVGIVRVGAVAGGSNVDFETASFVWAF